MLDVQSVKPVIIRQIAEEEARCRALHVKLPQLEEDDEIVVCSVGSTTGLRGRSCLRGRRPVCPALGVLVPSVIK